MTVSPDARELVVKVALSGAADIGKLAILRAIGERHGYATVSEHPVGPLRVHRVEWMEPEPLADGRRLRVSVHSLTGQTSYNAAEELLVRDADGLVFVADVDPAKFQDTWDSLLRLGENTGRNGYHLGSVALALQYHRADRHPGFDPAALDARLGVPPGAIPRFVSHEGDAAGEVQAFDAVLAALRAKL